MAAMTPFAPAESQAHSNYKIFYHDRDIDKIREDEYPMLKDTTYLDHAGTTLYPKSLIEAFSKDMMSNLFGNPHSASSSSQLSTQRVEDIRLRALRFFKADPDHFDLVFVANATAGIKLVADAFREHHEGFWYGYHRDSHTSLVGVRENAKAGHHCFISDNEVEDWLISSKNARTEQEGGVGLFACPAQSNMNGRRLPLTWSNRLRSSSDHKDVYSLLDAAALVSTSSLDLSDVFSAPDFTVLSFYKIFGFPDLGALIVRKAAARPLQRRGYFGGGTVELITSGHETWHIKKQGSLHEQLEDGTLPIHSIIALDHALNVHQRLYGSMDKVSLHTMSLTHTLYRQMSTLNHYNGQKVCIVYNDASDPYKDSKTQGPIIAFNVVDSRGEYVSNTEIEKLANIKNIQLRSGGLCNPGGIAYSLELAPWELKRNFSAGQRCGSENDIIGGKPTGMLRISLGAMSNGRDIGRFIEFMREFFVEQRPRIAWSPNCSLSPARCFVESLTVYPVKSCSGWQVPGGLKWDIRAEGLAWDREWCLVHRGTRKALSQKMYPKMALLRPQLDLEANVLRFEYHSSGKALQPSEVAVPLSEDPTVYDVQVDGPPPTSQVCGDDVLMRTYASPDISDFLTAAVGTPCTLARFPPNPVGPSTRHCKPHLSKTAMRGETRSILLSNESPILTISRSSLDSLNKHITATNGKAADASVFRANIVLAEHPTINTDPQQPYAEDEWVRLQIGENAAFDVLGPCRRCQMVCIDQTTAEKNEEPFVTLARTRRQQGKVFFGVHTALAKDGAGNVARLQVGDPAVPS